MRLPVADKSQALKKMWALMTQDRKRFAMVLILQLSAAALGVVVPLVIGRMVDKIEGGVSLSFVRNAVILVSLIVIGQAMLTYFATRESNIFAEHLLDKLRRRVVWAVTHLPLGTVERAGTGDMIGRTTNDVERIQYFIQSALSRMVMVVLTVTFTVAALIVNAPLIGTAAALSALPSFFAIRWYIRRSIPAYHAVSANQAGLAGVVSETIEQNGTIDAMSMGPSRVRRVETVVREIWDNELYTAWTRSIFVSMMQLCICAPLLVVIGLGTFFFTRDTVTFGVLTTSALYAMQLRSPLMEVGWWVDEMQFASVSLARIFGAESVYEKQENRGNKRARNGCVDVKNVHFSYDDGEEVLHGLSLKVEPGQTLAIVGPSGAGKSTLGRLIAGINPPDKGEVLIGGAEVTQIEEKTLHSTVAMVTQEHHVFFGTLAENLALAKENATREEMLEALACVGATWVETLEDGLDTKVGSGALALTPPQAQQLALARTVLLDPDVLVLDEATSLLDPRAARSLEHSLAKVLEGRTVISIAHRLYTAHDADKVAVVLDGMLTEWGSHDELVELGGQYAKLWESWQRG